MACNTGLFSKETFLVLLQPVLEGSAKIDNLYLHVDIEHELLEPERGKGYIQVGLSQKMTQFTESTEKIKTCTMEVTRTMQQCSFD